MDDLTKLASGWWQAASPAQPMVDWVIFNYHLMVAGDDPVHHSKLQRISAAT